jgi:flagellar motility protein MotE (MotC chaperone)
MFGNEKVAKSSDGFCCTFCNYKTDKKFNYDKHILTRKHLQAINGNEKVAKGSDKTYDCETCSKQYKDYSGLWRHKKKCSLISLEKNDTITSEAILQVIKQNQELQNAFIESNKQNQEFQKQIIEVVKEKGVCNTITNTNSHNKTTNRFNMNFFLNEKCKDAMNITDFVSSIKLTLQDLEKTAELGYVKGMTNIIVNGLNQLDLHKRPIHCSDVKRETLYVKDNNIWEKEKEDKQKITKAIKHISVRNAKQVGAWTKENEGYNISTNKKNDKYLKIVSEANGGEPEEINKIIANVSTHVTIPPL